MINGNPNQFLDTLYSGQDIIFIYNGIKYWFQGYTIKDGFHMEIIPENPTSETYLWTYNGKSSEECKEAFLKAPIFNGKSFWEAENAIAWVDD